MRRYGWVAGGDGAASGAALSGRSGPDMTLACARSVSGPCGAKANHAGAPCGPLWSALRFHQRCGQNDAAQSTIEVDYVFGFASAGFKTIVRIERSKPV